MNLFELSAPARSKQIASWLVLVAGILLLLMVIGIIVPLVIYGLLAWSLIAMGVFSLSWGLIAEEASSSCAAEGERG